MRECKSKYSMFGHHKWLTERKVSGAGRTFIYKLNPPICEYCGEKKKGL
jgi:hypothetical protein